MSRACGAALSADALVIAHDSSPGGAWRRALVPADGAAWPSLAQALRDATAAGVASGPLRIALLPPLVELRAVTIPPVNATDARRLLTRAASRHFLEAREPLDVAVGDAVSGGRLAAAVPTRLLRALHDAARGAGSPVEVIVPAHAAWARAPRASTRAESTVVVECDGTREVLSAARGVPLAVRRFRALGDDAAIADAVRALGAPATTLDDGALAAAQGMTAHAGTAHAGDAWPLAFEGLRQGEGGVPPHDRRSWWLLGAAAALALGTVALQEIDVRRELDAVRARRGSLAPLVNAPAARQRIDEEARVAAFARGPRWSRVIATLGDALPADAYVTRLRGRGDTLVVAGRAGRTTDAFDALASASWVRSIVASAPVRRETTDDGVTTESFEFTIVLGTR